MQKPENERRDFIKRSVLATAAAACGSTLCSSCGGQGYDHHGEKIKLLSQDGELVEVDNVVLEEYDGPMCAPPKEARKGILGRKFVMVLDLAKCGNARKCVEACQKMHHLPEEKEWIKVLKMQDNEMSSPYWQPITCFHCDHPPCVKVCPVDATFKRTDGIVLIDTDRCIGCRFCMVACPYSSRVFDWSEPELTPEVAAQPYSPETGVPSKKGTVSKCDFCPDKLRVGETPYCATACPNGVIYFGDENEDTVSNGEETLRLSQLLKDRAGYRLMEDFGTKPRVYYLPPVDRVFPFEKGLKSAS